MIYLNQTEFGACSQIENFIIAVRLSVIKFFRLTGPQSYSILGKMRSLDANVDSPKSNTAPVLSSTHSLVVHSTAKNQRSLHVYGTPLRIVPAHLVKSSVLEYIAREGNYWHTASCCQKESCKTIIRFFIGKPFEYCFQRDKKFNLITEITCLKHGPICSAAELGKCLSPAVAAQWIRMVNLPTLHCYTYYPSPKLSQQINIKENGAIWKEIERVRRTAGLCGQDTGTTESKIMNGGWPWESTMSTHAEFYSGQVKYLPGMMDFLSFLALPAT